MKKKIIDFCKISFPQETSDLCEAFITLYKENDQE